MDRLDQLITDAGFSDFRWTDGSKIAVAQWVRFKCVYACDNYGNAANCPPNAPPLEECRDFFDDYERIAVIHIEVPGCTKDEFQAWKKDVNERMISLERDVFLAGYHKTMVVYPAPCSECPDCVSTREECRYLDSSRPTPEALGVDVFATARSLGYPIEVLTDRSQVMNRYAFLLVE